MRKTTTIGTIFAAAALTGCAATPIIVNTDCTNVTTVGGLFPINRVTQDDKCHTRKDAKAILDAGNKTGDVATIATGLALQRKLNGDTDTLADVAQQEVRRVINEASEMVQCEVVAKKTVDGRKQIELGHCKPAASAVPLAP